jgi:XRE family transcriptional regulator, regulator of sulfur utilization
MEDITLLVALNLKRIREAKKLSLEKLAELTGVSKSMLGQIERGDSSPTVSTLSKISKGLKTPFSILISPPKPDATVVNGGVITPLVEDSGRYRQYLNFPIEEGRRFELHTVEMDAGGYLGAEAHQEGAQEILTVYAGELMVRINNQEYRLLEGDSIRFKADQLHIYQNSGRGMTKINMVIYYAD